MIGIRKWGKSRFGEEKSLFASLYLCLVYRWRCVDLYCVQPGGTTSRAFLNGEIDSVRSFRSSPRRSDTFEPSIVDWL